MATRRDRIGHQEIGKRVVSGGNGCCQSQEFRSGWSVTVNQARREEGGKQVGRGHSGARGEDYIGTTFIHPPGLVKREGPLRRRGELSGRC